MTKPETQVSTKAELSMSERFMQKVIAEFTGGVGDLALTDFQKRLCQNYFISIDATLKTTEEKRVKSNNGKKEQYQNLLPVTWSNINMELLARNVISAARVGLDPAQKNHVNMIPYKNNATSKYDIGFINGYRGVELIAKKYGLDIPDHVIIELVYSNDKFKSFKKDRKNNVDTYEFDVVNDFDRGTIVGGFYYHLYSDKPEKNKLVVFSQKDIEKRKPKYASPEFWGGEKDKWEDGKKVGKEQIDGWRDEMCWKTIARAAYGNITIDSQKIDDDYISLKQAEAAAVESAVEVEIATNANKETIDIEATIVNESPDKEPTPEPVKEPAGPFDGVVDEEPAKPSGPSF